MNGNSEPPAPKKVNILGLVELGTGGIILGLIVFVLLLVALNYFNILSLSRSFPLLSFLPTKQQKSPEFAKTAYLATHAARDLPDFVQFTVKGTTVSRTNSKVDFVKNTKGQVIDSNRLILNWTETNFAGTASISYSNKLTIDDKQILIFVPKLSTSIDPQIKASKYLKIEPMVKWDCTNICLNDKNTETTICENFWTDKNKVKRGVGILSPILYENRSNIFICEVYPTSPLYNRNSCSNYKEATKGLKRHCVI